MHRIVGEPGEGKAIGTEPAALKLDQVRQIIKHVTKEKVGVIWVYFDAFYSRNTSLLADLVSQGSNFIADVPDSLQI